MELYANSKNFIDEDERKSWEESNAMFIDKIDPPSAARNYYVYTIDLPWGMNYDRMPNWLKINSIYIDFNLSRINIEESHLAIPPNSIIELIDNEINDSKFIEIKADKLQHDYNFNFKNESYKTYLQIDIVDLKLETKIVDDYQSKKNHFSFPFLKSILKNNGDNSLNEYSFTFVEIELNAVKVVAFAVTFKDGSIKYYDFSHSPEITTTTGPLGKGVGNPF